MIMSNTKVVGGIKCNGFKASPSYSSICSNLKCGLTTCYGSAGYGAWDGKISLVSI